MIYQQSKRNKFVIRAIINDVVVAIFGKADRLIEAEIIIPLVDEKLFDNHWVVVFRDGEFRTFTTGDDCRDCIESFHYSTKGVRS